MKSDFDSYAFNMQVFEGFLQNLMDEQMREWENRERMKETGLPERFGIWLSKEQDAQK